MSLRKAAEMAFEAMDKKPESWQSWLHDMKQAKEALRQALAEGVVQEFKLYDDGVNISQEHVDEIAKCKHEEKNT